MKAFGLILLMLLVLVGFSLGMDILLGYDLENSINHAFNPFHVRETAEIVFFFLLIFALIFFRRRKKAKKKKQQSGR